MRKEPISLPDTPAPPRYTCAKAFYIYAADGDRTLLRLEAHVSFSFSLLYSSLATCLTPFLQREVVNARFIQFMERAERSYVKGKPRFLTDPEHSFYNI